MKTKYNVGDVIIYKGHDHRSVIPKGCGVLVEHEYVSESIENLPLSKKQKAFAQLNHIERQGWSQWRITIQSTPNE